MTSLRYKIGSFITADYVTALNYAKDNGGEIEKLYIFDNNCDLKVFKNEEEVENVSC